MAEFRAWISNAVFLPVLERQIGKESERKMLGQKEHLLKKSLKSRGRKTGKREGGIHSWETRIPMPRSQSLFRGDLSHTTVNATEQTDGMGLQCKYETEGRA